MWYKLDNAKIALISGFVTVVVLSISLLFVWKVLKDKEKIPVHLFTSN